MNIGIEHGIGANVLYLPVVNSTNTFLRENSEDLSVGTVVWAGMQTRGRGRGDNRWESPGGKGLYFSALFKTQSFGGSTPIYSLAAGLAVKEGIEDYAVNAGLNPRFIDLKWPNDLLIAGKKVAGILLESSQKTDGYHIVLGVGVNAAVDEESLPAELQSIAGSLQESYGGEWKRQELLKSILLRLESRFADFDTAKTVTDFRTESRMWGKKCVFYADNTEYPGICKDISDQGELIIVSSGQTLKFFSGTLRVEW